MELEFLIINDINDRNDVFSVFYYARQIQGKKPESSSFTSLVSLNGVIMKKCPIFPGASEGFCLKERCHYFYNEVCNYETSKDIRKAAQGEDRKKLEQALLKQIRER